MQKLNLQKLFLALMIFCAQEYVVAAAAATSSEERGLDDQLVDEAELNKMVALKFKGSDETIILPKRILFNSVLLRAALEKDPSVLELEIDPAHCAGFAFDQIADLLGRDDLQKILEDKDNQSLYRLLLLDAYLDIPALGKATVNKIAERIQAAPVAQGLELRTVIPENLKGFVSAIAETIGFKEGAEPKIIQNNFRILSVAWSPDGKKIVSGSDDNTVRIWDAATGELLRTLVGHTSQVNTVAWSPDGTQIASGSLDRTIRIWNAFTGELLKTLIGHTDWVTSVVWSSDGTHIASCSYDKTVRIWNAASGELLRTLAGHAFLITSVAWSPDGKHIASGSADNTVRIWDAATGVLLKTLAGNTDMVKSVAWSPDEKQIASGSFDGTMRIWGESLAQIKVEVLVWLQEQEELFEKKRQEEEERQLRTSVERKLSPVSSAQKLYDKAAKLKNPILPKYTGYRKRVLQKKQ